MPHANPNRSKRLDPRLPLVLDTRTLGSGASRSVTITAPAPANLGVELVSVPEGAELELDVELERVTDGVLVTGTVRAPLVGECARCLDMFASAIEVRFTELFTHEAGDDEADGYLLDGDLLDLESALRDALVLELPLAPLCAEDCPGLCSECGVRLADAGAGHRHADADTDQTPDGTPVPGTSQTPDGTPVPETRQTPDGTPVPETGQTPAGAPVPETRKER